MFGVTGFTLKHSVKAASSAFGTPGVVDVNVARQRSFPTLVIVAPSRNGCASSSSTVTPATGPICVPPVAQVD